MSLVASISVSGSASDSLSAAAQHARLAAILFAFLYLAFCWIPFLVFAALSGVLWKNGRIALDLAYSPMHFLCLGDITLPAPSSLLHSPPDPPGILSRHFYRWYSAFLCLP